MTTATSTALANYVVLQSLEIKLKPLLDVDVKESYHEEVEMVGPRRGGGGGRGSGDSQSEGTEG